ncbi:ABC transporter ATP-binding protein [Modestobacter lapidis]|nr:ABC transporter ATP-binding protein [Modestobacter lapidis]
MLKNENSPEGRQPTTESEARIFVEDLEVAYATPSGSRVHAVVDFSLDIRRGEFLTLIGPSGCGKTSILKAVGGLITPDGGDVRIGDTIVTGPVPDQVAYVFQDFALFPWRTALGNVEVALELKKVPKAERRERAREALATVGLADAADRHPHELSGGMKQRVAVARALVSNCDVLLLDEPFGALDEQTRLVLGTELLRILESLGKTIIFVTHNLQEAVYLSDRVVAMSARPARIKEIIEVDIPRPRSPDIMVSEAFTEIQRHLFSLLYEESALAMNQP